MSPLNILLLSVLATCSSTLAKTFDECDNVEKDFIKNPDTECSYVWIYCDGADSVYCDEDICLDEYDCLPESENEKPTTISATTILETTTLGTTTTDIPSSSIAATSPSTTTTRSYYYYIRENCVRGTNQRYPYPDNANYYYHCMDGYLVVQECGRGYIYNPEGQACDKIKKSFLGFEL